MPHSVRVALAPELYPADAIAEAMIAFKTVVVGRGDTASEVLTLTIAGDDLTIIDEFLNYALMAALERHLASQ